MIDLDLRTLTLSTLFMATIFGSGMFVFARKQTTFSGLYLAASGLFLTGIAWALLGLRGMLPDMVSVVISNTLIAAAYVMTCRGTLHFYNIRLPWAKFIVIPLLACLASGLYYFLYSEPSVNARIVCISSAFAMISLVMIIGLGRVVAPFPAGPAVLLRMAFVAVALFHVYRIYFTLSESSLPDFMGAGMIHSFAVLASKTVVLLSTFIIIWSASVYLQTELEQLARIDTLTRIFNRRVFEEEVEMACARARRNGAALSLVITDIDHFKQVNDTHGHQIGDEVLRAFAQVLRDRLRESDVIARYGGEEFVVMLPDTELDQAFEVANEIRERTHGLRFHGEQGVEFGITASFGVSQLSPKIDKNWEALLKRADDAMYAAKHQGRDRVIKSLPDSIVNSSLTG